MGKTLQVQEVLKRISVSLLHAHIFQVIKLIINTCIYIFYAVQGKKDEEIGKQLESANAPFELGCFLYFFVFLRREVNDK